MKQALKHACFFLFSLLLWAAAARLADNPIILPAPQAVLAAMLGQLQTDGFYAAAGWTIGRALCALILSMLTGILLAFLCRKQNLITDYIDQAVLFLRSIPNISFIMIMLFWLPRWAALISIPFLLVFPIIYSSFTAQLRQLDEKWRPVLLLYPQPLWRRLIYVYLPLLKPLLYSSLQSASSLCFKSTAMAEVLCQAAAGIGRSLQQERFNINMAGVFAYTLWLLLIIFCFDQLIRLLFRWLSARKDD